MILVYGYGYWYGPEEMLRIRWYVKINRILTVFAIC